MIRVYCTKAELGAMTQRIQGFMIYVKARDRRAAERDLVGFLISYYKLRGLSVPKESGWKIKNITIDYTTATLQTNYIFMLTSVTDRIAEDADKAKQHEDNTPGQHVSSKSPAFTKAIANL